MATRFYLPSSGAAAVNPNFGAAWDDTSIATRLKCVTTKIASAMTTVSFADAVDTQADVLFRQYVSNPITAQTVDIQTITTSVRCKERATTCNMRFTVRVGIVSNDGVTSRGNVLALSTGGSEINEVALTSMFKSLTSSAVTALDGDREVIEIGISGNPDAGSDHDSDLSIGDDAASDLAGADGDTDADNPWMEFANTITFEASSSSSSSSRSSSSSSSSSSSRSSSSSSSSSSSRSSSSSSSSS